MVRWFLSDKKPVNKPAKSSSSVPSQTESKLPINPHSIESKAILMPGGVMNIMLGYESKDATQVGTGSDSLMPTLFNAIKPRKLKDVRALLQAVVDGKPIDAKALLDEDLSLGLGKLEEKDVVVSLSGHRFNLSPYQAAMAVQDTQMEALIKSYVDVEFKEEAVRQYNEQHLEEQKKTIDDAKWAPILKQRDILLDAIRDSKKGDITSSGYPDYIITERKGSLVERELAKFYELLDVTLNEVITPGKRPFNPDLLLRPLQMYNDDKLYKEYFGGRWDDPRALFFVQKVVGYEGIQRFMPVNFVQAHQDWLDETARKLGKNEPQARGTRFEIYRAGNLESVDFYPLRGRGTSGFNFMIYGGGLGYGHAAVAWGWGRAVTGGAGFRSLCQSKTASVQNLCRNTTTLDLNRQSRLV